ncbi:hypothetical protein ACROYT_G029979 [Oculina patagonica]
MLSKIFSFGSRKTGKKHSDVETETPDEIHTTKRPFPYLAQDEIRVLVFKDSDRKGKTLLFDSKAVPKDVNQPEAGQNRGIDTEQGCKRLSGGPKIDPKGNKSPMPRPKLQNPRPSHDAKMLGEMIFGSVAMTYKGQTVKVHEIRTPHQLLLTNVFAVKPRIVMPNCCDGSDYLSTSSQVDSVLDESTRIEPDCASLSSQNSFSKEDSVLGASSKPMAVPGSSPVVVIDADGDSGFTASVESSYLEENLSSLFTSASSPCGSYHRRLHRSHVTSIDHSFGRKSEESSEEISPLMRRRPKLGIGIIFALGDNEEKSRALQGFFFAHFPLFESHIKRLRLAVENACFLKTKSFSSQVIEAVQAFRENIHNLLAAPRLKEPVWLNMMTHSSHRSHLCEKFMVQLVECLRIGNSRETNFFMAGVLTAVLQYHLAWVSTVMPAGTAPSRAYLDKHSSKTLDLLAQSHPYNPLWAQLGDLYGAIGFPLRVARTVIVGKNSKLVEQVLNILSYFIRCTEVFEHAQKRDEVSKDDTHDKVSNFGEDSICSQCGKKSLAESEISGKTCSLTSETGICSKCKQKCDGKCTVRGDLNNKEDKESLRDQILTQLQVTHGIMHCSKCSTRINSNSLDKLAGVEILQSNCTCNKISNGGVPKELKHFIKDANLLAMANHHCNSFQCYCCKDTSTEVDHILSGKGSKFKCYCESGCDSDKHLGKQDSSRDICNDCLEKLYSSLQKCKDHQSETNDSLSRIAKISEAVQSQDILRDCSGHTDNRVSETDSCVSDDTDTGSVRSSLLEKCADVEETIASYGRSGSADSGIHQSPLSSPCAQRPVDFPNVISCQGEDNQIPEELPLPRIEDVNCCPNPNSKSDEWRSFNNFGRSMFAGIVDSYLPDLVLQGVQDNNFRASLSTDLKLALQHSVVDDPVSEAVCIIANTDKWTCEVVSVKKNRKQAASDHVHVQQVEVSNLVFSMLSSLSGLWDIKMSAEFCLMHLEDKLKEIYLKSKVITERLRDRRKLLTRDDLTKMLSVDDNDVPLLLAVASTHSPQSMPLVG